MSRALPFAVILKIEMAQETVSKDLCCNEDWTELLDSVDTFLIDCDGVLWTGDKDAVTGAQDAIAYLKEKGKRVFFVSNNSSKSRREYLEKFKKLGFSASLEEIVPSSFVAAYYLKNTLEITGKVLLFGMPGFEEEIVAQGIKVFGTGPDPHQGTLQDWLNMELDPPSVDAVVVGLDYHFSYMKLIRAASYLANPQCHYVATNEDSALPTKGNIVIPGTGTLVRAVAYCSSREPIIVGKPHKPVYDAICSLTNAKLDPATTCMIGDGLGSDIAFGKNNNFKTLLVYSGNTSREKYRNYTGDNIADYTSSSIATLTHNKKVKLNQQN